MTRETKVGLVVAGSFVCLVSVVAASRLQRKPDEAPTESVAQTSVPRTDPPAAPKEDPKKSERVDKAIAPAVFNTSIAQPNSTSPPALPQGPPALDVGPALQNEKTKKAELDAATAAEAEHQNRMRALQNLVAQETKRTGAPQNFPGKPLEAVPPALPASPPNTPAPPLPQAKELVIDANGLPTESLAAAAIAKVPLLPTATPYVFVGPLKEAPEKTTVVTAPAAPPLPAPGPVATAPPLTLPKVNPPMSVQVADLTPKPAPPGSFKDVTNPNLPAMGSGPKYNTAPPVLANPTAGTLPQVTSFTPQPYNCQPDDTSFEAVSNHNFGSPKYARALLEYNRGHPKAQDNLRQENPRLLAGQQVYIPPRDFLESHFASLIDNRPIAATAAVSISSPLNPNAPSVATATPTIGRAPTPNVPTKDATKPYRVAGDGQMLIEIAQQTLGDRGRWSEIYRLNPTIRPEYPVPGGTEIRLPSNASVP